MEMPAATIRVWRGCEVLHAPTLRQQRHVLKVQRALGAVAAQAWAGNMAVDIASGLVESQVDGPVPVEWLDIVWSRSDVANKQYYGPLQADKACKAGCG